MLEETLSRLERLRRRARPETMGRLAHALGVPKVFPATQELPSMPRAPIDRHANAEDRSDSMDTPLARRRDTRPKTQGALNGELIFPAQTKSPGWRR